MGKIKTNLYELPKDLFSEEIVEILLASDKIRIERIISRGQTSDIYDQDENEVVILLKGRAKIQFAQKGELTLVEGDYLNIKAHEKHQVTFTSINPPCVWLCIFY